MRKSLYVASMLAVTVAVAPACASKKFVRGEVGNVNTKVDTLSETVEETQERTRQNAERIGEVDKRTLAAAESAQAAGKSALDARAAADGALARANAVGTEAAKEVATVNTRVNTVEEAARRLVFEVTLDAQQDNFTFGNSTLPDTAKSRLDEVITDLKTNVKSSIYIEIEGHTDNVGAETYNHTLGLERAEAVKRYLYEQHQIPLHKMNVISYGEEKPVAPNNSREGRAQNRRVVVKILS